MPGWNTKIGIILKECCTDDEYWQIFNYIFSNQCMKRNSYKFGLIKSILDNITDCCKENEYKISYHDLFSKFAENYWNLVSKYKLKQMRPDNKSEYSKIEQIIYEKSKELENLEFSQIPPIDKEKIIKKTISECKKNVIGALYTDSKGLLYQFDLYNLDYIQFTEYSTNFIIKHKTQLEILNYYSWAKFIETINPENKTSKIIEKLELATPQRKDLSEYRDILLKECSPQCFYCGKKLNKNNIHVDHFIPWSFVHTDNLWNFVLSCSECNCKKNNKLYLDKLPDIEVRNSRFTKIPSLNNYMKNYNQIHFEKLIKYALLQGFQSNNHD